MGDARSQRSLAGRSSMGRTARASEWGHTKIFSEGGSDEEEGGRGGRAGRGAAGPASTSGRTRIGDKRPQGGLKGLGAGGVLAEGEGEPMDLLESGTARRLVKSAAGVAGRGRRAARADEGERELPRGDDGRLFIEDEEAKGRAKALKRKRVGEEAWLDADDSDNEDLRGFAGLDAAAKSVANAKSVRFAPSIAASLAGKSVASHKSGGSHRSSGTQRGQQHSGDRFKAKKAGTGGDVKGGSKVEPYAYWQMDRKMLNRRRGKQAVASKGLAGVVGGAKSGALKGAKARRAAQQSNKRAKR